MCNILVMPIHADTNDVVGGAMNDLLEVTYETFYGKFYTTMYTTEDVYIYGTPDNTKDPVGYVMWNTPIDIYPASEDWYIITSDEAAHWIESKYLSDIPYGYNSVDIPKYSGFKSYMDYHAITSKNTPQYKIRQMSYTGEYGCMQVNNRFCVAVGTGTNAKVGDYGELVLKNGFIIPIIISDIKDNKHTDSLNLISVSADCASEFIVNTKELDKDAKNQGTLSAVDDIWDSIVDQILIYDYNIFD